MFVLPYPETHLISQACPASPWRGRAPWTWGCPAWSTRSRRRRSRHSSAAAALWHTCGRRCADRAGSAGGWTAPCRSGRSAPSRCFWSAPGDGEVVKETCCIRPGLGNNAIWTWMALSRAQSSAKAQEQIQIKLHHIALVDISPLKMPYTPPPPPSSRIMNNSQLTILQF